MKNQPKHILAICGSSRSNSANLLLIKAIEKICGGDFKFHISDTLLQLPFYNPDLDKEIFPEIVQKYKTEIINADGIFICSPEYVFSLPGVLKNGLEWLVSTTILSGKPAALITASSAGESAHQQLILIMNTLGAKFDAKATMLVSAVKTKINSEGIITDANLLGKISILINSFKRNIEN